MIRVVENLNKYDAMIQRREHSIQEMKDFINLLDNANSDEDIRQLKQSLEPYSDNWYSCEDIIDRRWVKDGSFESAVKYEKENRENQLKKEEETLEEIKDLNDRLKKCKTVDDLEELEDLMDSYGKGYFYFVKTKTGGMLNSGFKYSRSGGWAKDDYTVSYITDQDNRYRECKINNLWKYIYIA